MFRSAEGIEIADTPTITKQYIREKVWDYFEDNDLADFPRPVTNRIPNFKGAGQAGQRVKELECFKTAQTVKVNPDKPQEEVRFLTLEAGKALLVPTPRLRSGLLNLLQTSGSEDKHTLRTMSQTEGIKRHSSPQGLEMTLKIDLLVLGSVAVSRRGHRLGKGEGYCDLEFGMMRDIGVVSEQTVVLTTVHDCQVFDDLPDHLFEPHDLPVDLIVTPTQVIEVTHTLTKPPGIIWSLLSPSKLRDIPILRVLRERERGQGIDVTLANGTELPPDRRGRGGGRGRGRYIPEEEGRRGGGGQNIQVTINVSKKNRIVRRTVEATDKEDRLGSADLEGEEGEGGHAPPPHRDQHPPSTSRRPPLHRAPPRLPITFAIFLGKVPPSCRVRELKEALQERDVKPADITWRGRNGFAFLRFTTPAEECEGILGKLEGLTLQEQGIVVERAKERRHSGTEHVERLEEEYYEEDGGGGGGGDGYPHPPTHRRPQQALRKPRQPITFAIFLGKVPPTCRVRELKDELIQRKVQPSDIAWRGRNGFAFLRFCSPVEDAEQIISALEGLRLQGEDIVVEKARGREEEEEEEELGERE